MAFVGAEKFSEFYITLQHRVALIAYYTMMVMMTVMILIMTMTRADAISVNKIKEMPYF